MKIILASGSPRRKELLSYITDDFEVSVSDVEEIIPENTNPFEASEYLAKLKAESVSEKYPDRLVIGCDTSVILDGEIMGKPADENQCREYLERLSGKIHVVATGCCIILNGISKTFTEFTKVYFRNLTDSEITDYISSGEPFDKAGGYGIQGKGSLFITRIEGDFFNVVGLPVCRLNTEINLLTGDVKKMNNAFKPADILIPGRNTDMYKWSVIACDQYTSEPEYWNSVEEIVGDVPSALRLILPEIYLESDNVDERIENIHKSMNEYLESGIFDEYKNALVYVERIQSNGILRQGIIGKIDLEEYNYEKGSTSQVRATETTVVERIPPRVKIRKDASLELPHIMILIDDEKKNIIEPLAESFGNMQKLYDFELMKNGGKIKGYLIPENIQNQIFESLDVLGEYNHGLENVPKLLYAMGDGNHSLATAKEYYESLKRENPEMDFSNHPARYALAEIVNLHSPALQFEAIHRIVTGADNEKLLSDMSRFLEITEKTSEQSFTYVTGNTEKNVYIGRICSNLTVGSLQVFLDKWLKENPGKIDYIHGADTLRNLVEKKNGIGFILPDMNKNQLFPTVIKDGSLPRKTFSMGHADDKRFYIECRKIFA